MATVDDLNIKVSVDTATARKETKALQDDMIKAGNNIESNIWTKWTKAVSSFSASLRSLGTVIASVFAVQKIYEFAKGVITLGSNLEQTKISFTTMLWSAEKANVLLSQLSDFAKNTPFELVGIRDTAKQLLAFWFSADQILPALKSLWDVASWLSVPIQQVAYAYGQVRVANQLYGTELMQFTQAWVPLIAELAKQFWVTESAVKKMVEDGKVSFKDVEKAFQSMSWEGGKFANLMDAQSKTVAGQWSNLKDSATQLGEKIGTKLLPTLQKTVNILNDLIWPLNNNKNKINDYDEQVQKLTKDKKDLIKKYTEGKISAEEFGKASQQNTKDLQELNTKQKEVKKWLDIIDDGHLTYIQKVEEINKLKLNTDEYARMIAKLQEVNNALLETIRLKKIALESKIEVESNKPKLWAGSLDNQDYRQSLLKDLEKITGEENGFLSTQLKWNSLIKVTPVIKKDDEVVWDTWNDGGGGWGGGWSKKTAEDIVKEKLDIQQKWLERQALLDMKAVDKWVGTAEEKAQKILDINKKLEDDIELLQATGFEKYALLAQRENDKQNDDMKNEMDQKEKMDKYKEDLKEKAEEKEEKQNEKIINYLDTLEQKHDAVSEIIDKNIEDSQNNVDEFIDKIKELEDELVNLKEDKEKLDATFIDLGADEVKNFERYNQNISEDTLNQLGKNDVIGQKADGTDMTAGDLRGYNALKKDRSDNMSEQAKKEQEQKDLWTKLVLEQMTLENFKNQKILIDENYKTTRATIAKAITDKDFLEGEQQTKDVKTFTDKQIAYYNNVAKARRSAWMTVSNFWESKDQKWYASWWYTGSGSKNDIAGVVHAGEWVAPAEMIKQAPLLFQSLEKMRVGGNTSTITKNQTNNFTVNSGMDIKSFIGEANWRL